MPVTSSTHRNYKTGASIMASLLEASNSASSVPRGVASTAATTTVPPNSPVVSNDQEIQLRPIRGTSAGDDKNNRNGHESILSDGPTFVNQSNDRAEYTKVEELSAKGEGKMTKEFTTANDNASVADSDATEIDPDIEEDQLSVKAAEENTAGGSHPPSSSVGGNNGGVRTYNRKSQRCVPCQWFVRKCSGKNGDEPCLECTQEMARRGREWTCYMDDTFIRPRQGTAEGALPDNYRFPGKYGRKRHAENSSNDSPLSKKSKASRPTPRSQFSTPPNQNNTSSTTTSKGTPATMVELVDLLKSDLEFCKELLKQDEGGASTQSTAYRHVERVESQLDSELLELYIDKEEKIRAASVSAGLKEDLMKGNVEDYLGRAKEEEDTKE